MQYEDYGKYYDTSIVYLHRQILPLYKGIL